MSVHANRGQSAMPDGASDAGKASVADDPSSDSAGEEAASVVAARQLAEEAKLRTPQPARGRTRRWPGRRRAKPSDAW